MPSLICAGIDPNPQKMSWNQALLTHISFVSQYAPQMDLIKLNQAFFLKRGGEGLSQLQEILREWNAREFPPAILDAKFGEVPNTFSAYLDYTFDTLGAQGVTINPYFGEDSIQAALEKGIQKWGTRCRVFVLAATSAGSKGPLRLFQEQWKTTLEVCTEIRDKVIGKDPSLKDTLGVVVGANRPEVLFSDELLQSRLAVLSPGLGPQGADWGVVEKMKERETPCYFPLQRALFNQGDWEMPQVMEEWKKLKSKF